jgi:integrase
MAESRKDNKGRALGPGERQKQSGQYEYRYYDKNGIRRSIYSWRLKTGDSVPKGKRDCKPLRQLIFELENDKRDNIDSSTAKTATLNSRFDIYIKNKIGLKPSTKQNYKYMYERYVRGTIGNRKISEINYTDIQEFYNGFIQDLGFKITSLETIHTLLNPVFDNAIADNLIRNNPCPRAMKTLREELKYKRTNGSKKHSLTASQQKALIDYIKSDNRRERWANVITVLLGSGLRIGECLALTWADCDFKENSISITKTLSYRKWEDGKCYFRVMEEPKTKDGIRRIPMFDKVREALLAEKERQNREGTANMIIDGYGGWVFTNRYGKVLSPKSTNDSLKRIIRDYNMEEKVAAKKEKRKASPLPNLSNHILRHTFCTRLMEESCKPDSGLSVKLIQSLMGHADFKTTMDIYTDISDEFMQERAKTIQGSIYLG